MTFIQTPWPILDFALMLSVVAIVSFVQNAAFTWSSRSRNSGDPGYHRYAAWCSNGVWFVTVMLLGGNVMAALMQGDWWKIALLGLVYIAATTEGSVMAMKALLNRETGAHRVGAAAGPKT